MKQSNPQFESLNRAYSSGDRAELEVELYFACAKICGSIIGQARAEDMFMDVYMDLLDSIDEFDPSKGAQFSTWVYRCCRNATIDYLRQAQKAERKQTEFVEHFGPASHPSPLTTAEMSASLAYLATRLSEAEVNLLADMSEDFGMDIELSPADRVRRWRLIQKLRSMSAARL